MCRMSILAATALMLSAAQPAMAKEREKPVADKAQSNVAAPAQAPRRRATPEERAIAQRADPLARAAFWAREADIDPRDTEAGVNLAQAMRSLGKYEEAAAAAERVLLAAPNNVEALLEVARAHISRGQGFYAVAPAERAQSLAPRDWRAASLLAVALEQASRDDEALAAHRRALSLAPEEPSVLANFGMFQAGHGQADDAERLLRLAASKPGATAKIRQNLALVLGLQGKLAEAERLARQDLPPEVVANNLAYLRAVSGGAAAPRSWDAMRAQP